MNLKEKIEKKGYKVVFCIGYKNGVQGITSVQAQFNGFIKYKATSLTKLSKLV